MTKKSEDMDIVMLALPRWDGDYSSTAWSLAKEFSRTRRVFYIDNPVTIKEFLSGVKSHQIQKRAMALLTGKNAYTKINSNLITVTPRLTVPVNFLPEGSLYERLSVLNDSIVFRTMKKLLSDFNIKDFIFINSFNPFYARKWQWPEFFKPALYVYHTVDDISHSAYIKKHGPRLEEEAIRDANLTFTTSMELKRLRSSLTKSIYYLPNAADVSLFRNSLEGNFPVPPELKNINRPIVAYTGHLDVRLDYDLIKFIFKAHPDKMFLMIGPSSIEKTLYEELVSFPNVMFTGKRHLTELPAYLHYVQCTIIPFKCNTLTKSIYPLKVNEYLAAGKPVISTPFSDDIVMFKGIIDIADNYETFSQAISTAISSDTPEKMHARQEAAEKNTWEARAEIFWSVIDSYLTKN